MACLAAVSEKGPVRSNNQDACCIEVARTSAGEMAMAVICDGVGGLEMGELASATVVARFVRWFEEELPGLVHEGLVDFDTIEHAWKAMLGELNELIQTHAASTGGGVGTTFSGIFASAGHYLVAHVGDTRVYQIGPLVFRQITDDQTLLAQQLARGDTPARGAEATGMGHVILQAIGTERMVKPALYEGEYSSEDMFVLCSDGAYRLPGSEGIRLLFQQSALGDTALAERCKVLVDQNVKHGEKDNITIACFAMDSGRATMLSSDDDVLSTTVGLPVIGEEDDVPTAVLQVAAEEDAIPTSVFSQRLSGSSN